MVSLTSLSDFSLLVYRNADMWYVKQSIFPNIGILFYLLLLLFNHCHVQLFVTSWTAACQASLSFPIFQSLLKLMSIESVILSNHPILCHSLLLLPSIFPNFRIFPNESLLASDDKSIGASASVLPMNIQGWLPLGLTGLISLQSKGLSRVFSSTTVHKHQFFCAQPSLWSSSHIHTRLLENHSFDYMDFCQQSDVPAF